MSNPTYNRIKKIVREQLDTIKEEKMSGELEDVEKVAAEVPETEASEYATSLEQDIDFMKALKIQEQRLVETLARIEEAKDKLRSRILKSIDKE